MIKIGITGGIGSGKTTICKVFETLGIPVFYADTVAKQIMTSDPIVVAEVSKAFGTESYFENGTLNNKHIAAIVFNNERELATLNAIVHPAVFMAFDKWDASLPKTIPYSLKEAALLFESNSYKMCDKSILVTSPNTLKIARVTQRDNVTEAQVLARMDKQFSDEQKLKMADYVIENNEQNSIILQVLDLHQQFLKL